MNARNRGEYFQELQIVQTLTMNKFLAEESPPGIAEKIKQTAEKIKPRKMFDRNTKQIFIRGITRIGKTSLA